MLPLSYHPIPLVYLFGEILALTAAWFLTLAVRLQLNDVMAQRLSYDELVSVAPPLTGILLVWCVVGFWLYRRRAVSPGILATSSPQSVGAIVETSLLAGATAVVVLFFSREFGANLSRSFVLLFIPISLMTLLAAHWIYALLASVWNGLWPSHERIAVVGGGPEALQVIDCLRAADLRLQVAGIILPHWAPAGSYALPMPVLGRTNQLAEVINRERLDRIVIADDHITPRGIYECTSITRAMGVAVTHALATGAGEAQLQHNTLSNFHLLEWRPRLYTRKVELCKRMIDILLASLSLLVLSPILAACAVAVKLTSKGPLLYKSKRVGRGGRHFTFLKFRSMRVGSENRQHLAQLNETNGHLFKIKNDPRVTRVGRILRRYSLDELPQLVNVLRGEMSMVGPRPLPAEDLAPDGQSAEFAIWAQERSKVLPGITGLWQIRGRSDLDFEQMVELDIAYIRHWSLGLDLRILLETPVAVVAGRGAY